MGLKTRLNKLEQGIKPKGKDPKREWLDRCKKHDEMWSLYDSILEGDLKACIRWCEICGESELDSTYKYRDWYIQIVEGQGREVDLSQFRSFDIWYQNLKAVYRFLEARAADPQAKEPVLTVYQTPGE